MSNELAVTEPHTTALSRAGDEMSIEQLVERVRKVKHVQREVMTEGVHFGKVPGVDKPTLLKPGAEVLGMTFRLAPDFDITEQVRDGDHLTVVVRCRLHHAPTGTLLGAGMGSCSTKESRYAYRKGERQCPSCGKETIIKGKEEYGGGWLCFAKRGGCGAKFAEKDAKITSQVVGRIENPDVYDQHNTVLKMAIKRAHVAAILFVTCASEIFTQDVEDMPVAEAPRGEPSGNGQRDRGPDIQQQLEELLYNYKQAATADDVQRLDGTRKKLWARLSTPQKKVAKEAADRAMSRVNTTQDADFEDADRGDAWEEAS